MDSIIEEFKKRTTLSVNEDEPLKNHTSIRIGGEADYFVVVKNINQLMDAVRTCMELKIPYFVLGGGSNIVVSDKGFRGLVIKNESGEMTIEGTELVVDSGIMVPVLIRKMAELDLGGLEFLSGIPGTLGGAVVNNAGAFGDSIGNHIKSVIVLDPQGEVRVMLNEYLGFEYRNSIFKKEKDFNLKGVILRVRLITRKGMREEIIRKIENYLRLRKKQPKGYSCGSYFKNPKVSGKKIEKDWEGVIKEGRAPAGYLLERVGAKEIREGGACVSKEHANWIINPKGRAKATEIKNIANNLKKKISDKYGIELEEEIEYIGFDK